MQTIVFNMSQSGFNLPIEAISLKVGYLLGNEVICAGDTPLGIHYREQLSDYSFPRKIRFLKMHFKKNPEAFASFETAEKVFKKADKMVLNGQLIAQKKKIEKMVEDQWEAMIAVTEMGMDKLGFMVLKPFVDDTLYYLHVSNSEMEGNAVGSIRASEVMQLLLLSEDELTDELGSPELFLFGNEFLSGNYPKPAILNPTDAGATGHDSIYLQHIVTLPPLSTLSTLELQQVREALSAPGTAFRLAVDEWCDQCYEGAESADRLSVFTQKIMPSANDLQQAINDNDVLQKEPQPGLHPIELWAGEMPVWEIWKYYHHHKAFGDETWQKLQAVKDDSEYKHQRWPVMMLQTPDVLLPKAPEPETEEAEIKPVRKYLQID